MKKSSHQNFLNSRYLVYRRNVQTKNETENKDIVTPSIKGTLELCSTGESGPRTNRVIISQVLRCISHE
jgi:hypothetical protein